MPSGRPGTSVRVTSRPVPSFRCGILVSPLGAGNLLLRRQGSRLAGGALRAGGRQVGGSHSLCDSTVKTENRMLSQSSITGWHYFR